MKPMRHMDDEVPIARQTPVRKHREFAFYIAHHDTPCGLCPGIIRKGERHYYLPSKANDEVGDAHIACAIERFG